MTISKINSTPAFRGFIKFNAKDEQGHYCEAEIDANDITNIKDGYERCHIKTKSGEYTYKYSPTTLWVGREDCGRYNCTNINTVLNAYMAAKMSDDNFTVELPYSL